MHYDLIIIGTGLSGLMAAKTAVDAEKKVLLVGKGLGALALFSNTIDVLGTLPARTKLVEGLSRCLIREGRRVSEKHKNHPDRYLYRGESGEEYPGGLSSSPR